VDDFSPAAGEQADARTGRAPDQVALGFVLAPDAGAVRPGDADRVTAEVRREHRRAETEAVALDHDGAGADDLDRRIAVAVERQARHLDLAIGRRLQAQPLRDRAAEHDAAHGVVGQALAVRRAAGLRPAV